MKFLLALLLCLFALNAQEIDYTEFEEEYNTQTINDPFESYNRVMTKFNWGLYDYVLSPTLNVYNKITPKGLRLGVNNFFDNLGAPLRFVTHLLQFRVKNAFDELGRFALNSTFGLGGVLDIATPNGLYLKESDFGIMLNTWGVDGGFHIVLPFLGPKNFRDVLTMPLNAFAYPVSYVEPFWASAEIYTYKELNYIAIHKNTIETFRNDSLDSYILLRNSYEQNRNSLSKD